MGRPEQRRRASRRTVRSSLLFVLPYLCDNVNSTVAVLALAWLAMAEKHDTGSLRGLSRWALAFVMRGRAPNGSAGTTKTLPAPPLPISASGNALASADPEEDSASTTSDIQTQV